MNLSVVEIQLQFCEEVSVYVFNGCKMKGGISALEFGDYCPN